MPYGILQKLISEEFKEFDEKILIESPFQETTRGGNYLNPVYLALTPTKLIIASRNWSSHLNHESAAVRLRSLYSLDLVNLTIFKRTYRQSIKALFFNDTIKYFDLGEIQNRKIFWKLWCMNVQNINKEPVRALCRCTEKFDRNWDSIECIEIQNINNHNRKKKRQRWLDKDLYLGSKREEEDELRPTAVPGIGLDHPQDLSMFYLKPQYFGCWDQAEHWVQCENCPSEPNTSCYQVCTYTGEPTSNITYTKYF